MLVNKGIAFKMTLKVKKIEKNQTLRCQKHNLMTNLRLAYIS